MNKYNLGKMIDYFRRNNDMTLEDLGNKLDKSPSAISRWISGDRSPMIEDLIRLTEIFKTDIDTLMYGSPVDSLVKAIPLLGTIAAGVPIEAIENIEDYFNIDSKIKADYALRIKGDSMINVNILDGDIVFIRKQSCVDNGEIGAILVDGEATLKRFYKMDGHVVLQAENPNYQPMIVEYGEVIVLGKMVACLREYK